MVYFTKWKALSILLICLVGILFSLPNFLSDGFIKSVPVWLPHKKVNLGLDLQGGSHLLLEVVVSAVIKEQLDSLVDEVRIELRKARIRFKGLRVDGVTAVKVKIAEKDEVEKAYELLRQLEKDTNTNVDNQTLIIGFKDSAIVARRNAAMNQSIEIVRRRVDQTGTQEPTIQRQGLDRILLQLPGIDDPERVKRLLGKTAKMTFRLNDARGPNLDPSRPPPIGSSWLSSSNEIGPDGSPLKLLIKKKVMVSGEDLVDSRASFDQQTSEPVVTFRFNARGGKKFGNATAKNVNRRFAIILDNKVISAPVIREPILGGSGQISGNFTVQETNDLSLLLRAGALPAPLVILEERSVGPGLGKDSIVAGKMACMAGMIAVVIFMFVTYGRFGAMADFALVFNIILILAILSMLQATLTLPGIAGIVLTIGMAVDANVLVFERIREELRLGRTPISAIDSGYRQALTTIIDANVTTLIAAIILYIFGSGPVRGFAVTLAVGIITSMFTAIMLTRLLIAVWLKRNQPKELAF